MDPAQDASRQIAPSGGLAHLGVSPEGAEDEAAGLLDTYLDAAGARVRRALARTGGPHPAGFRYALRISAPTLHVLHLEGSAL